MPDTFMPDSQDDPPEVWENDPKRDLDCYEEGAVPNLVDACTKLMLDIRCLNLQSDHIDEDMKAVEEAISNL